MKIRMIAMLDPAAFYAVFAGLLYAVKAVNRLGQGLRRLFAPGSRRAAENIGMRQRPPAQCVLQHSFGLNLPVNLCELHENRPVKKNS